MRRALPIVIFCLISFCLSFSSQTVFAAAAPQVTSSIPADGNLTADPATDCIEVFFSEPMRNASAWRWSSTLWNNSTTTWAADMRSCTLCRPNGITPLPLGSYWIQLNPSSLPAYFKSDATGLALPLTTIHFTVTAGGSNIVDNTPPTVLSTEPANGSSGVDPLTAGLTVVFSEQMDFSDNDVYDAWTMTNNAWDPNNVIYSLAVGDTSLSITRQDGSPLPAGTYTLTLNPAGTVKPMADVAGNIMAETSISFTVNASAPPASGKTYYVPYFSVGASTWTGLALANNSSTGTASVVVRLYNHDGIDFSTLPAIAIAPDGQYNGSLAVGENRRGWIRITSDEELSGLCFMGSDLMADIPFTETLANELMIPHVAQDDTWDTSIMICNPDESSATSLTITYSSGNGASLTYPGSITLAPLQSGVYELGEMFRNHLPLTGGRVHIVSGGSRVAAFALYSSEKSGGDYYAGINAVPLN